MQKYYFDFNPWHYHRQTKLSKFYAEVIAESFEVALQAISWYVGFTPNAYGSEQTFNTKYYTHGCYCSIKQRSDESSN